MTPYFHSVTKAGGSSRHTAAGWVGGFGGFGGMGAGVTEGTGAGLAVGGADVDGDAAGGPASWVPLWPISQPPPTSIPATSVDAATSAAIWRGFLLIYS